jgi:hypothetical protein
VPVDAFLEARRDEREGGRSHQRGADSLDEPSGDQGRLVACKSAGKRAGGEQEHTGDEDASSAQEVGCPSAEE